MTSTRLLAVALLVTLALGVWLRWALAGAFELPIDFANLRHAHSHLGAYGVLFPLAFVAWRDVGAPAPGPRVLRVYAAATALACFGFLRAGYGIEAIIGSTVVGALWLHGAFRLRHRVLRLDDPLALVPFGIVAAMACVPFIALTLRRDPLFAQHLVATFLSALLLVVVAPSALAAIGARAWPSPLLTVAGLSSAAALGAWPSVPTRLGLAVYALFLLSVLRERSLPLVLRASWAAVGAGLLAMALALIPNVRPAVLGALHFLVLGPVLLSLTRRHWSLASPFAVTAGFVAIGLLTVPLVLQAFDVTRWTMEVSALGGTLVLAWWFVAVVVAPSRSVSEAKVAA